MARNQTTGARRGRRAGRGIAASLAGLIGLALGGCGGGDQEAATTGAPMSQAAAPPAEADTASADQPLRVRLSPDEPRPGQQVRAELELDTAARSGLRFDYAWTLDGDALPGSGDTVLIDSDAERGDRIQVTVLARDGAGETRTAQASGRVGNSPPLLHGVVLEPSGRVTAGDDIVAVPKATDVDGDELDFEFRWEVGDHLLAERGPVLPATRFGRGDTIRVAVRASDGELESEEIRSDPIPVVNSLPRITSTPGSFDDEGRFVYPLAVEDPDGDSGFTYRLARAPAGMEIDLVDGTVRWQPAESQAGTHPVVIEVSDGAGGTAVQSFTMDVGFVDADSEPPASADPS